MFPCFVGVELCPSCHVGCVEFACAIYCDESLIMPFAAVLWALLTWIFRAIVIQFLVMGVCLVLVTQLMPAVINYVAPFVGLSGLNGVFSGLSPAVWFIMDFFAFSYGLPLVISAFIARFLIRRIPFIG